MSACHKCRYREASVEVRRAKCVECSLAAQKADAVEKSGRTARRAEGGFMDAHGRVEPFAEGEPLRVAAARAPNGNDVPTVANLPEEVEATILTALGALLRLKPLELLRVQSAFLEQSGAEFAETLAQLSDRVSRYKGNPRGMAHAMARRIGEKLPFLIPILGARKVQSVARSLRDDADSARTTARKARGSRPGEASLFAFYGIDTGSGRKRVSKARGRS